MSSRFSAGVARGDITPPIGIAHGNWSAQVHERAEGVDLPLFCTVLAASDGDEEVLIVDWELLLPPDGEWLRSIRERITSLTGVPATHIRISSSHTHAGPSLERPWFDAGAEMIGPYIASLTDKVAGACLAAHRSLQKARVAGGKGFCPVNVNRRRPRQSDRFILAPNPEGFSDHEVGVIRIDAEDGRPLAILVNFAAHPTILAWDNRLISPDYPGTLRRTVEALTGATCLFLQGAAGNQTTIRDFSCRVEDACWVGRQIGLEAVRAAELIETQPASLVVSRLVESSWTMGVVERSPAGESDTSVRCLSRKLPLPVWRREPPSESEIQCVEKLKRNLAELRDRRAPEAEIREANRLVRRAVMGLGMAQRRSQTDSIEIELQAIRLGSSALVGIPAEPFAEIGAAVKSGSPFATTFFSGNTNGGYAYVPIPEAYAQGGYEVWMTPFAPEAAGVLVEGTLAVLHELNT